MSDSPAKEDLTARQVYVEPVMGTVVSIDIRNRRPAAEAVAEALRWLKHVDATFSTWREDSAISCLNHGTATLDELDGVVAEVLARCAELSAATDGYFSARARGGLDPSALVKGWAVQRAADGLTAAGFADFCLTAGGDVVVRGAPGPGRPWRIGIQHPRDRSALAAAIPVHDAAVATSGAYERGAHITDPHTGRPPRGVLSVTVTGPDLGLADAYSTAAFAMGAAGPAWTLGLDGYEAMTILDGQDTENRSAADRAAVNHAAADHAAAAYRTDIVLTTPGFPGTAPDMGTDSGAAARAVPLPTGSSR